jgi:branched-chain amino acid transport system permease protein
MRSAALPPTIAFLAIWGVGVLVPLFTTDEYQLDVATRIIQALLLAMGLRLVLTTGRLNLAHVSFMGIGAYVSAALTMKAGYSFWIALPVATLASTAVAVVIGLITLRLTGAYFFLVTFAFLNVVELFFQGFFVDIFGGSSGLVGIPRPDPIHLPGLTLRFESKLQLYYLGLFLLLTLGGLLVRMDYSKFGLICNGIRQAEKVAGSVGINPLIYKVQAFVAASAISAIVGCYFAHSQGVVHYTDFNINAMLRLVVFVVVGGASSIWGTIGGTVAMSVIAEFLRGLQTFELIVYGLVLILAMLFFPDGISGLVRKLKAAMESWRRHGAVP